MQFPKHIIQAFKKTAARLSPPSASAGPAVPSDAPPAPVIPPEDDFLGWLRFVNAGMLDRGNVAAMDVALAGMPQSTAVVEIGSFCGLSSNVIACLRRKHGAKGAFFSCDRWIFEGTDAPEVPMGDGGITFGEYRDLVKGSYLRNIRAFSRHDLPHTVELFSDEFFDAWARGAEMTDVFDRPANLGGPIGFCYIDGDHTYAQARRDFEHTDEFLAPGGYILFDDSADGTGWEVCRVVQEVFANPAYELVGKYGNYLFRKRE